MTSPVFAIADRYIDQVAELNPCAATYLGIAGHDHEMTDFSPAGHAAMEALARRTLAELNGLPAETDDDRLAAGVMRESLESEIMSYDGGEMLRSIRPIAGDVDGDEGVPQLGRTVVQQLGSVDLGLQLPVALEDGQHLAVPDSAHVADQSLGTVAAHANTLGRPPGAMGPDRVVGAGRRIG